MAYRRRRRFRPRRRRRVRRRRLPYSRRRRFKKRRTTRKGGKSVTLRHAYHSRGSLYNLGTEKLSRGMVSMKHSARPDGCLQWSVDTTTQAAMPAGACVVARIRVNTTDHPFMFQGTYSTLGGFMYQRSSDQTSGGPYDKTITRRTLLDGVYQKVRVRWARYKFLVENREAFPIVFFSHLSTVTTTDPATVITDYGVSTITHKSDGIEEIQRKPDMSMTRIGAFDPGVVDKNYTKYITVYVPCQNLISAQVRNHSEENDWAAIATGNSTNVVEFECGVVPSDCLTKLTITESAASGKFRAGNVIVHLVATHMVDYRDVIDQ